MKPRILSGPAPRSRASLALELVAVLVVTALAALGWLGRIGGW